MICSLTEAVGEQVRAEWRIELRSGSGGTLDVGPRGMTVGVEMLLTLSWSTLVGLGRLPRLESPAFHGENTASESENQRQRTGRDCVA